MKVCVLTRDMEFAALALAAFPAPLHGCAVHYSEIELLQSIRHQAVDLLIIDIRAGDSGWKSLFAWRRCHRDQHTPVLVVTDHQRAGLADGLLKEIDDFVSCDTNYQELYFRAFSAVTRSKHAHTDHHQVKIGKFTLDQLSGCARNGDDEVVLTPRQFAIAWLFFSNPGVFLSRTEIAKSIWASSEEAIDRRLEQQIYQLRKKLNLSPAVGVSLKTVYSLGYKLEVRVV